MGVMAYFPVLFRSAVILAAAGVAACATTGRQAAECRSDYLTSVAGGGECLALQTFGAAPGNSTLVVFIHGGRYKNDRAMDYMAGLARRTAGRGVTAAVPLRPGYRGSTGGASTDTGGRYRSNWLRYDIDAVSDAIARLKAHHGAQRVVLVGHSIGAAIAGVILGRTPGLADAAVLAGCPCDMAAWGHGHSSWPSPHAVADAVPTDAEVVLLTGAGDAITAPRFARDYAAALAERGVAATFVKIAGAGHGVTNRREVREAVNRLARGI